MPALPTYFTDFLTEIRISDETALRLQKAHKRLRSLLRADKALAPIFVETFLLGSYRRATMIVPKSDGKVDVDVILVTNLDRDQHSPHEALKRFERFLDEHYKGLWRYQGRSIGIEEEEVELDLVVTSAPSECNQKALHLESLLSATTLEDPGELRFNDSWRSAELHGFDVATKSYLRAAQEPDWKLEPLWIPDREARDWQQTHPLAQLIWTREKNKRTSGYFINVVKAVKWWRRFKHPTPEDPNSFPLERIVGACCPDDISSVANGFTRTLEAVETAFLSAVESGTTPVLSDYGVDQNVLKRVDPEDFAEFFAQAGTDAGTARKAFDETDTAKSSQLWQELFGSEKFPGAPDSGGSDSGGGGGEQSSLGGFSTPKRSSSLQTGRFA